MKVERRKCRLRRMMHSQERRYEMGNTLRYEGFRNVLLSQMRKRLSGKLGIKQISRRETVKNNDTVMEMLLVELEDGRQRRPCIWKICIRRIERAPHLMRSSRASVRCLLSILLLKCLWKTN